MKIGIAAPASIPWLMTFFPGPVPEGLPAGAGSPVIGSLVEGLWLKGHQVSVYTLVEGLAAPVRLVSDRFSLYVGPARSSAKLRALTLFSREAAQVRDFIQADRPDIVNAHWSCEYGRAAALCGLPHLISLRDHSRTVLTLQRDYYRLARYLTDILVRRQGRWFSVNSPYLGQRFRSWQADLPVLPDSLSIRYLAARPKRFPREGLIRMVSILSGWSPLKNAKTALKAVALLRRRAGREITYDLVGPGFEPDGPARAWARDRGLDDGVNFLGPLPHGELMGRLPEYDLLCHPSLEESFGDTLIEAMAAGLPVVAGRSSGAVPWVLNQGLNGILTDVASPSAICQSIQDLLDSPVRYERLSWAGLDRVRQYFASEPVAALYLKAFESILDQARRKAP